MTLKDAQKRNNGAAAFVGIVFVGLGIYDLQAGNFVAGSLFTVSGAIAALQVLARAIHGRKAGGKGPSSPENGKNG